MNVIVVSFYGLYTPHLETDLELVQNHLDSGDSVTFLECRSELLSCDINPNHELVLCMSCRTKRSDGVSRISRKSHPEPLMRLTAENREELEKLPAIFRNPQELKAFMVDNFDAGYAVLSSVVSLTRDPDPNMQDARGLIRNLMVSSVGVYRSLQNRLGEKPYDRVYVYNGRHAPLRAVVRACESRNVRFFTHERGSDLGRYSLFENALPHNREHLERLIQQAWIDAEKAPNREQIAAQFYEKRAQGMIQSWHSYVMDQKEDLLPANWDSTRRNIVIFNSSDDEFVAIGESWANPIYRNQSDAIHRIVQSLPRLNPEYHVFLRMHPNLKNARHGSHTELLQLKASSFTVIRPEEPVSSYAMLRHADKVVTFGSTMGIEATFWGIPSILAGVTTYGNLGGTYNPKTHEEVVALMNSDLKPQDRLAALIYGYYMSTFGIPFRHFTASGILEGKFVGKQLDSGTGTLLLQWLGTRFPWFESACNYLARVAARRRLTRRFRDSE